MTCQSFLLELSVKEQKFLNVHIHTHHDLPEFLLTLKLRSVEAFSVGLLSTLITWDCPVSQRRCEHLDWYKKLSRFSQKQIYVQLSAYIIHVIFSM